MCWIVILCKQRQDTHWVDSTGQKNPLTMPKHLAVEDCLTYLEKLRRFKIQLQDLSMRSCSALPQNFTGCLPKLVLSISYQIIATSFSLIQPVFTCLIFFMHTLYQDSSDPLELGNYMDSTHYKQNIWTSFFFLCCSFCQELPASWN